MLVHPLNKGRKNAFTFCICLHFTIELPSFILKDSAGTDSRMRFSINVVFREFSTIFFRKMGKSKKEAVPRQLPFRFGLILITSSA